MAEYYDRQGQPLTLAQWVSLFDNPQQRSDLKRVAETTLANGRWVSTVWLGIDHSFGSGPPLIFETMVFPNQDNMSDLDCDRYSTEDEAIAGHARMCEKWAVSEPIEELVSETPTTKEK